MLKIEEIRIGSDYYVGNLKIKASVKEELKDGRFLLIVMFYPYAHLPAEFAWGYYSPNQITGMV